MNPARLFHLLARTTDVAELLRDLVDTYNVFIVGDPTGRELDQVRLGPQERNEANAVINLAVTITEAVEKSEGLAKQGYYGYHPNHKVYYEVMDYTKMLSDATKRNRISH